MLVSSSALSLVLLLNALPSLALARGPPVLGRHHNYRRAHSYGKDYKFDARSGWQSVGATDLPYKYNVRANSRPSTNATNIIEPRKEVKGLRNRRATKKKRVHSSRCVPEPVQEQSLVEPEPAPPPEPAPAPAAATPPEPVPAPESRPQPQPETAVIGSALDRMTAVGTPQDVVITWYTDYDLLNPSCWTHPEWAPSDETFACALTLEGWTEKPSCFKFLELCNGPTQCIFVRVIDTCAGCAKGSKHVDLTKAAFGELAPLDVGKLTVQMRIASDPDIWDFGLWGPQV